MKSFYSLFLPKQSFKMLILISCLFSTVAFCQPGVLDQSFGINGKVLTSISPVGFEATSVAIQSDGKLVVLGHTNKLAIGVFAVVRYQVNGSLDSSFANNGKFTYNLFTDNDRSKSIAVQPDGKILIGGHAETNTSTGESDFVLIRLTTNGSLDSSFGTNGLVITDISGNSEDELFKIIVTSAGQIFAGGYTQNGSTSQNGFAIAKYTTNGSVDTTYGIDGIAISYSLGAGTGGSMVMQADGKIIAASSLDNATNYGGFGAIRFTISGSVDASFGINGLAFYHIETGPDFVYYINLQSDGKILLAGEAYTNGIYQMAIIRLNPLGLLDSSFGNGGKLTTQIGTDGDAANQIHAQPDGKIVVTGTTSYGLTTADYVVVRYNSNGSLDSLFGVKGIVTTDFGGDEDESYASLLQPDGKIVIVGEGQDSTADDGFAIARYENNFANYYNVVVAKVFMDNNLNSVQDSGEVFYVNPIIAAVKNMDTLIGSSFANHVVLPLDTGSYTIQMLGVPYYYIVVPPVHNLTHATYFNTDTISFAVQTYFPARNAAVTFTPLTPAQPGFSADYGIVYQNKGTDTITTGMIEFIKKSNFSYLSSSMPPSSVSGDTLRWNITNLLPQQKQMITVKLLIPASATSGDTVRMSVNFAQAGDVIPADNKSDFVQELSNLFAPYDVAENHGGYITTAQVAAAEDMYYTIRFQNRGTDTAFNVFLRTTLSNKLNTNSLEMIASSSNLQFTKNDAVCSWTLAGANIPPSGWGYLIYKVKPKATLVTGDTILSSAAVYFNTRLPLATTVEKTLVVNAALPLRLIAFTAQKAGKNNLLQWSTADEINVLHFSIERSSNGKDFSTLGQVSAGRNQYTFTDVKPLQSTNYYRLKMIDRDGFYQYSAVRQVYNDTRFFLSVSPNPAKDFLVLRSDTPYPTKLSLQILDLAGRIVMNYQENVPSGSSFRSLNINFLKDGFYYIRILTADHQQHTLRFEKM